MGRSVGIALLVLLFIPSVCAASLFNKWVYPGETFTVQGELFSLSGTTPGSPLLTVGTDLYLLTYGDCTDTLDGSKRICYKDCDYIKCERGNYTCPKDTPDCCPYDVTHVRYEAGEPVWGVNLEVTSNAALITIKQTADVPSVALDEWATVRVSFENTGEDSVLGAVYRAKIPADVRVSASSDFTQEGDTLVATFNINPGFIKTLSFDVAPTTYGDRIFRGNLSYTYKGAQKNMSSPAFTLKVPTPFTITRSLSPGQINLGKSATYAYTIKNTAAEDLRVRLVLKGIVGITFEAPVILTRQSGGLLTWDGTLGTDEQQVFTMPLKPSRTGKYNLTAEASMTLGTRSLSNTTTDTLTVKVKEPVSTIKAPASVGAHAPFNISFILDNKLGDTPFANVRGVLTVGNESYPFSRDSLAIGQALAFGEFNFTAPVSEKATLINFTVNGTYETLLGESFTFGKRLALSVKPNPITYRITQTANATKLLPGSSLSVTVRVKNEQAPYSMLTITDTSAPPLPLSEGIREKELSINRGEEREAYTYRLVIPDDFNETRLVLTTTLIDQQTGEQATKSTNLTVTPAKAKAKPVPEKNATPATPSTPAPASAPQKGFFTRLFESIGDFFAGMFS
jgi:hypothetical protein